MIIDYQVLIDQAMLDIVKKVLINAQDEGLEEEQCFYISFKTDYPEVILSKSIKSRYPKEITIVLQYQYRNLQVSEDRFSVNIAFNGINESIEVPFSALTSFADPSVNFSLQFRKDTDDENYVSEDTELLKMKPKPKEKNLSPRGGSKKEAGKVVFLEQFRNKSK